MKIAIVHGGYSSECNASTENAKYIGKALLKKGYEVYSVPYGKNLIGRLRQLQTDFVFVCVQGRGHGDGTIQAVLEQEGIPFTGSGAHAAAMINDKILSKMIFEREKIRTPKWEIVTYKEYQLGQFNPDSFGYPFVAKAPSEGGSFGIQLIPDREHLHRMEEVFAYESPIFVEEYIEGDFYTIALLEKGGKLHTLPCIRGIDMEYREESEGGQHLQLFTGEYGCEKAILPEHVIQEMETMSKHIYQVMGARDLARVDFMIAKSTQQPYVLEINGVPGLKPYSLFPGAARLTGMVYEDLIEGILLAAIAREEQEEEKC